MRDYQVTEVDFQRWKAALSMREGVAFRLYPQLTHLFVEGEGIVTPAEYQISGHVAEEVVSDIIAWIEQNVARCFCGLKEFVEEKWSSSSSSRETIRI